MNKTKIISERTIRIPSYDKLETVFTVKPTSKSNPITLQKVTPPNNGTCFFRLWHGACNYAELSKEQAVNLATGIMNALDNSI